jgi:hypothetical protein
MFRPSQGHLQGARKLHSLHIILNTDIVNNCNICDNETGLNVIADRNIGCEVNAVYETPEDGLVEAETCVGVEEYRM